MGKGDKKSRRGKIVIGSFGKKRPRKHSKFVPENALVKEKVEVTIEAEKIEEKKVTRRKKKEE